jgi:5-hydroxyisourate hydrolase-like protein (transthyretin family)
MRLPCAKQVRRRSAVSESVCDDNRKDRTMLNSLKWMLPALAALGLFVGLAGTLKAEDAKEGVITGKVVDKDGGAVADATIRLAKPRPQGQGGQGGQRPEPLATATTDKDGKFELKFEKGKVADGEYSVSTNVQGKGFARQAVKVAAGKADPATVELKLAERRRPAQN